MAPDEVLSFVKTHGMDSHAEIYTVDDLLKARPDGELEDFAVLRIPKYRGEYKPACIQCDWLLDGVQYVK